jgi:hypothetical protein
MRIQKFPSPAKNRERLSSVVWMGEWAGKHELDPTVFLLPTPYSLPLDVVPEQLRRRRGNDGAAYQHAFISCDF